MSTRSVTSRTSTGTTSPSASVPAGTGKTYLAVACAVEALHSERVRRIVLVRPAVEAGERLGFLPGDLTQKVDALLNYENPLLSVPGILIVDGTLVKP
ncbi:MAG: PhoH family protein [Pseudomonadota bacterium]